MSNDDLLINGSREQLLERLKDVSRRKAHLEMINRMLTRLSEVSGLDQMVRHILKILMETIGAANVAVYHICEGSLHYSDIYGASREIDSVDDNGVRQVMESGVPQRVACDPSKSPLVRPAWQGQMETWLFPLVARGHVVGVVAMEEMQLADDFIWRELFPFFTYAALMLDNEITNYQQLTVAHRTLQESEDRLRVIFDESPFGQIVVDPETLRICHFNRAAHQSLGYEPDEFGRLSVRDFDVADDLSTMQERVRLIRQEGGSSFETVHRTRQGDLRNVMVYAKLVSIAGKPYVQSTFRDITEQKRLESEKLEMERRLLHTQKLESLGVLTGGIAHDFNNLLAAIMGNLDLSLLKLPDESSVRASLEQSYQACQRAADLIRQMLAYSGQGTFEKRWIDLSELVQHNAELLRTSIPRTINIVSDTPAELPLIMADPGQIQQVVMNLITNAAEAIGERQGMISISTGVADCTADYLVMSRLEQKPEPGRFVWLEVSDDGAGMDDTVMMRIFEPFFTTKFTGRGLGMSAVLGIIRSHAGAIMLESSPGRGTRFRVLFPALGAVTKPEQPELSQDIPVPAGGGTVLVVDDEEMILNFCGACVEEAGFRVLTASNGLEAVAIFAAHADEISLVILDLSMPQMDGVATFAELRLIRPDVQVVISSGYGEQNVAERFGSAGPAAFLQKPFAVQTLLETISRLTDRPGAEPQG